MIDPNCCGCDGEEEFVETGGRVAVLIEGGLDGPADAEPNRLARSSIAFPVGGVPFEGALSSKSMSEIPPPPEELPPASSAGMGLDENE